MVQFIIVLLTSIPFAALQDSQAPASATPASATPEAVPRELPGLHNVHRATEIVFLGSEPQGEEAFISLKKLGITTIVSVDGATPDVELARQHGLRYIHIPTGYDGVDEVTAKTLTRVAREVKTPLYVHCHHGKHRGPAAAAIVCLASGTLTSDQALTLLKTAGTGKDYTGLWKDVKDFQPLPEHAELPPLLEIAPLESLPAAMARIDRNFDNLKLCKTAGWKTPTAHPDLNPVNEALLVQEALQECCRRLEPGRDLQLREWLQESGTMARALHQALKAHDFAAADPLLSSLGEKCVQCHVAFRNH
jgi:protein tyrosine phosphatase (PTP) superfamily phosphohydrolase (DUF442 family)